MKVEISEKDLTMQIEYLSDIVAQLQILAIIGKAFYVHEIVYSNGERNWEIVINNE